MKESQVDSTQLKEVILYLEKALEGDLAADVYQARMKYAVGLLNRIYLGLTRKKMPKLDE
jgi:hypothetical protein